MSKIYHLTKERLQELEEELDVLKTEKRLEVADKLKRAKELGDLSENAEYLEAREDQSKVESRIIALEDILRNAVLIKKSSNKDNVHIGSTVEVKNSNGAFKYTIVGSEEARPEANLISNESPLGRAFLGKKVGEVVAVDAPKGKVEYRILKIE